MSAANRALKATSNRMSVSATETPAVVGTPNSPLNPRLCGGVPRQSGRSRDRAIAAETFIATRWRARHQICIVTIGWYVGRTHEVIGMANSFRNADKPRQGPAPRASVAPRSPGVPTPPIPLTNRALGPPPRNVEAASSPRQPIPTPIFARQTALRPVPPPATRFPPAAPRSHGVSSRDPATGRALPPSLDIRSRSPLKQLIPGSLPASETASRQVPPPPPAARPAPGASRSKGFSAPRTPLAGKAPAPSPPRDIHSRSQVRQPGSMPVPQNAPRTVSPRPPIAVAPRRVPLQPKFAAPVPTRPRVLQSMEVPWWQSAKKSLTNVALTAATAVGSAIFKYPNLIEMEGFTSCLCFVFNTAGQKNYNDFISDDSRELVFESIKSNWKDKHPGDPFFAVCPYDEDDNLTPEYQAVMLNDATLGIFGNRPLIVIIGHCSPGSSFISNDGHSKEYHISDVINAIRPALKSRSTIYLTPCNTGVGSATDPSFQTQFTTAIAKEAMGNDQLKHSSETLIVGTESVSVPAKGKVLTTGQSYSRVKVKKDAISRIGETNEAKFLKRQQKK
jgi:hypothetical protein